jgi:hypothetical protein
MSAWIETIGVLFLALAGCYAGLFFSRLKKPWWALGYVLPMLVIGAVALTRYHEALAFVSPLSWLVKGRARFATMAFAGTLVLRTPLSRLRRRREKMWLTALIVVIVGYCIAPFAASIWIEDDLRRLETRLTPDGVCLQGNGYTCGPAAAVTALRRLGFPAEEGDLAILAHTTPTGGTPVSSLAMAIEERFGAQGISVRYSRFENIGELAPLVNGRPAGDSRSAVIAAIKFSFLIDHYVALLEVTDEAVAFGDPLVGKRSLAWKYFEDIWRSSGLVLSRK